MKNFGQFLSKHRKKNKLTYDELSALSGKDILAIKSIEKGEIIPDKAEQKEILTALGVKKSHGKRRIAKILDLCFRLTTSIMALVTLLLCINGEPNTEILIILLSVGLVCSSLTQLPKIEN